MIDGITVLSQNEIMDITTWTLVITIIGIIISAISFLIFIFFNQKNNSKYIWNKLYLWHHFIYCWTILYEFC